MVVGWYWWTWWRVGGVLIKPKHYVALVMHANLGAFVLYNYPYPGNSLTHQSCRKACDASSARMK